MTLSGQRISWLESVGSFAFTNRIRTRRKLVHVPVSRKLHSNTCNAQLQSCKVVIRICESKDEGSLMAESVRLKTIRFGIPEIGRLKYLLAMRPFKIQERGSK